MLRFSFLLNSAHAEGIKLIAKLPRSIMISLGHRGGTASVRVIQQIIIMLLGFPAAVSFIALIQLEDRSSLAICQCLNRPGLIRDIKQVEMNWISEGNRMRNWCFTRKLGNIATQITVELCRIHLPNFERKAKKQIKNIKPKKKIWLHAVH